MARIEMKHGYIWLSVLLLWIALPLSLVHCQTVYQIVTDIASPVEGKVGTTATISATITPQPSGDNDELVWTRYGSVAKLINAVEPGDPAKYAATYNAENGEATLVINNLDVEDNGTYRLQLISGAGNAHGTGISVVVLVPPSSIVIDGGSNQSLEEEKVHNLTCRASGSYPQVEINWMAGDSKATERYETTAVMEGSSYTTTSIITLTPKASSHLLEYTCVVSGKQMSETRFIRTTLNVQYAPLVEMSVWSPPPYEDLPYRTENTLVKFKCTADAHPSEVTWKWFIDGEEIEGEQTDSITYPSIKHTMNSKVLKCEATNPVGSSSKEKTLHVYYGPRLTNTPDNVEVDLGDRVDLTCEADGNPTPSINWAKTENSQAILTGSERLTIPAVKAEDIGSYQCVVSVTGFPKVLHTAHVLLRAPPKIHGEAGASGIATKYSYSQGQTAVLSCSADVIPKPTSIKWTRGKTNTPIDLSSSSRFSMHEEPSVYGVTTLLTIKDLASNDFDDYSCTFVNELGYASAIVTLSQTDDFPWKWVVVGAVIAIVLAVLISVAVCCCRKKNQNKTSSAGSLSVVSNTTDNSIKKPADGMENVEISSLPEYGLRPIDVWRNDQEPSHTVYDCSDSPANDTKPELYGSYRASPTGTTFKPQSAYPVGNYGSYRVHHPRLELQHAPQYSTLPIRPSMLPPNDFNRFGGYDNELSDDIFPDPPPEHRLATNV